MNSGPSLPCRASRVVGARRRDALRLAVLAFLSALLLGAGPSAPRLRGETAEESMSALVRFLKTTTDESVRRDVLRGMKAAMNARRNVPMPQDWLDVEQELARSSDQETRLVSQGLGLVFGSRFALDSLRRTLADAASNIAARKAALDALLSVRDAGLPDALRPLLGEPRLRGDAIRGLAAFNDEATPQALLRAYPELDAVERRDALNTLASRLTYARPLMAALKSSAVPKTHLTADLVRQLRNLKDVALTADLEQVWGISRETSADKAKEIERYRRVYAAGGSTPGDGSRGRKVFAKVCQQCHTLFDTGGKVGPDLTGSNRANLDYILSNIIDPNAVIPNDYRSSTVETKDDRILTGIVKQQDEKIVTIQTANETIVLPRGDVTTIRLSELSMMPEGLLNGLADQEIRDLIYYLGRPGQVP
ncbi:MAG: c-type cytochrome [Verrucomicrobia bacterium]|nr:c-type cytochrome [Verrucomicrobiota bacterium]